MGLSSGVSLDRDDYEAIFCYCPDPLLSFDAQGAVLKLNLAAAEMFQAESVQILSWQLKDIFKSDELDSLQALLPGQSLLFEWQGFSGSELRAEVKARRLAGGALILSFRQSAQTQITQQSLKQREAELKDLEAQLVLSEARYRKLVYYAHDAVVLVSSEGRLTFASPAIQQILGYAPGVFCELDILEQIHPDDLPKLKQIYQAVLAAPGKMFPCQLRFRHQNGQWRWLESLTTNWLQDPQLKAIVSNLRDISPRIELEHKLQQALKMEAIGRLAGGVAHDFNNLLTVISGYGEFLLKSLESSTQEAGYAKEILNTSARAAELTRQLLAFSRQQILQPTVLDLNERLRNLDGMLARLIGENIQLTTVLAADLAAIKVDSSQLDQVIINLVINARDAMPNGGRLKIQTQNFRLDQSEHPLLQELPPGNYIMLAISDNGVGMDRETSQRVFEPFFTTKAVGKGTGLGLATVYGIVKQSGGHISVYSEPEHGSVFKIYLPAVLAEDQLPENSVQTELLQAEGETILLVEDEEMVRVFLAKMLEQAGYQVLSALNGEQALELVQSHAAGIDLLLTDLIMPSMGGRPLAEQLRETQPRLPIIFISGYTDQALIQHWSQDAEVRFLHKPFNTHTLLSQVQQALHPS